MIEVVSLEATAPVPDYPAERPERSDKIVVDKEDMEYVALPPKKGRPKKVVDPEQLTEVLRLYFVEKLSMRQVADIVGVSHMSIYRMLSDPNLELLI